LKSDIRCRDKEINRNGSFTGHGIRAHQLSTKEAMNPIVHFSSGLRLSRTKQRVIASRNKTL
jgi:hypothetical protein